MKILPISNKYVKNSIESFCIGSIAGFVEIRNEGYVSTKQYVHFSKVLNVRENELYEVHVQDLHGNISKDKYGNPIKVSLDDEQLEKVLRKYKIYEIGEEKNVINLLLKSEARFMLDESTALDEIKTVSSKKMEKYREYNFDDKKIIVFFVDGKRYSVVMNGTGNNDLELRNTKLKEVLNF